MTKVNKLPQRSGSKHNKATPYSLKPFQSKITKDTHHKKQQKAFKKELQDATCSVCMEYPHNAVLLLCSSHHKGCRPYMCATSCRYSNCLDQYKKAYTKVNPSQSQSQPPDVSNLISIDTDSNKSQVAELLCPLCRGQVKGWTVVDQARKYLNSKKRNCMQEDCSFIGSYKDLRKHVRADHPRARPREVDPTLAEKWKKLENDQERNDVMSTINSTMPGSIIMGDYVIEGNIRRFSRENSNYLDIFGIGSRMNYNAYMRLSSDNDDGDEDDDDGGIDIMAARNYLSRRIGRQRGFFLGGGIRRRRNE